MNQSKHRARTASLPDNAIAFIEREHYEYNELDYDLNAADRSQCSAFPAGDPDLGQGSYKNFEFEADLIIKACIDLSKHNLCCWYCVNLAASTAWLPYHLIIYLPVVTPARAYSLLSDDPQNYCLSRRGGEQSGFSFGDCGQGLMKPVCRWTCPPSCPLRTEAAACCSTSRPAAGMGSLSSGSEVRVSCCSYCLCIV